MNQHRRSITSTLGTTSTQEFGNQPTFSVPDESEQYKEIPQKEAFQSGQKIEEQRARAPREAVQRFEVLVGISRLTDDITLDGVTFSLRSLKSKEQKAVYKDAMTNQLPIDQSYILKMHTLAYSVYQIDGQPIEYIAQTFADRLEMLGEMDDLCTGQLFDKYNKMLETHNKALKEDVGITAEEVNDTVKKS